MFSEPKGRGAGENPANRFEQIAYEPDPDAPDEERPAPRTRFYRDSSRSIITTNNSPDVGFEASVNPYRGCEHGCSYCVSGDTLILMADGSAKPIRDLRIGDDLIGTRRDGWERRLVKTRVLNHWTTLKAAYRLRLENGVELVASGDHRFLSEGGWRHVVGSPSGLLSRPGLAAGMKLAAVRSAVLAGGARVEVQPALSASDRLAIATIEPLDEVRELFDITTGTGDFIANGVVSHNCFARPTHEYLGLSAGLDFETKILVKEDAPELLRKELSSPKWEPKYVQISGVTDCYQPIERRLELTRRCLQVFAEFRNPVGVITKNKLVVRDKDVLGELAKHDAASVYLSITTLDAELARALEPRASAPYARLEALAELSGAGVPAGVMIGPVIPGLNDHEIPAILEAAKKAGATGAGYVPLRLPWAVKDIFAAWLERHRPGSAQKVLSQVKGMRGGRLNDPNFGSRMNGSGKIAGHMGALFEVAYRRAGFERRERRLSTESFRRPSGPQLELFGEGSR